MLAVKRHFLCGPLDSREGQPLTSVPQRQSWASARSSSSPSDSPRPQVCEPCCPSLLLQTRPKFQRGSPPTFLERCPACGVADWANPALEHDQTSGCC